MFLCPQDWQRGHYGKFNATKFGRKYGWVAHCSKFRKNLLEGKRCNKPCSDCNANGTLLGQDHAKLWKSIYNI